MQPGQASSSDNNDFLNSSASDDFSTLPAPDSEELKETTFTPHQTEHHLHHEHHQAHQPSTMAAAPEEPKPTSTWSSGVYPDPVTNTPAQNPPTTPHHHEAPHHIPVSSWQEPPSTTPTNSWQQPSGTPPTNLPSNTDLSAHANAQPIAVVNALSVRGVEYTMMMLNLWILAGALVWLAIAMLNGETGFSFLAFPAALLIVCVPVFSWFFVRLRRAELLNPELRFDPSKRRLTQFTQIVTFAACLFNLIAFVYLILAKIGGDNTGSLVKPLLDLVVVFVVAGGILAYFWADEHRNFKS